MLHANDRTRLDRIRYRAGERRRRLGHVLVGIDDTPESVVAAAQAGVLRAPEGRLALVAVAERHLAGHAGLLAPGADGRLVAATSDDLERAAEVAARALGRRLGCEVLPVLGLARRPGRAHRLRRPLLGARGAPWRRGHAY